MCKTSLETRRGLALALGLSVISTAAHAGPPLITDDPDTPGAGRWEVNVSYGLQLSRERVEIGPSRAAELTQSVLTGVVDGLGLSDHIELEEPEPRMAWRRSLTHELPLVDINYGATDRDQIKFEIPVVISDPPVGSTEGGFGNLLVGYKYRFLDEAADPLSLSLYPQLELPTAARRLGENPKPAYLFPLQGGRHFLDDRLFVYGEVGFAAAPGKSADDGWFYGAAAEYELADGFTVVGEVFGSVPTHGNSESDVAFNVGFKWAVHENVSLMAAMGRSFRSTGPDHPEFVGFLGLQFTF